jgi:hypothetical protein
MPSVTARAKISGERLRLVSVHLPSAFRYRAATDP